MNLNILCRIVLRGLILLEVMSETHGAEPSDLESFDNKLDRSAIVCNSHSVDK